MSDGHESVQKISTFRQITISKKRKTQKKTEIKREINFRVHRHRTKYYYTNVPRCSMSKSGDQAQSVRKYKIKIFVRYLCDLHWNQSD